MSDAATKQLLESLLASLYSQEAGQKGVAKADSYLVAGDGQYLGRLTTNGYDKESIRNPYGPYGSRYSPTSIFNGYCPYGGPYGQWSAENRYCQKPPTLVVKGKNVCVVSDNQYVANRITFGQFVDVLERHLSDLLNGRFKLPVGAVGAAQPSGPMASWGREARIMAADGTFLGKICSNAYDGESIFNDYGPYGGKFSRTSIFNDYGQYGGEYATFSPFNKFTSNPPQVFVDGQFVGFLTANEYTSPRIDPFRIKEWAGQNGF